MVNSMLPLKSELELLKAVSIVVMDAVTDASATAGALAKMMILSLATPPLGALYIFQSEMHLG